ncbi:hypothetical protein [Pedobacter xixiisoli]|uniref:Uncharacterized protein n=1 Tax=Pedobacter xixiisoli TaxID=1476464 RepID=A0A286A8U1_9SPHI|nr:hypothetical protein [Pedobacter xixiisoli]SOD18330.1 hypothetical protein SAMN06297358_2945 [Pedobacter xixiisoli]
MKYVSLIIFIFIIGCNPIPKKDAHPEVPLLTELLKDNSKFRKVLDTEDLSELIFLNDDRILIKPNNSNLPFKIIEANKNVIFQDVYDWNLPFYVDKLGNLYFNRKKFFYPDYKKQEHFKTVVFADSLSKKSEQLKDLNDSLRLKSIEKYERELLRPYGLKPCEYTIVNTASCNVFTIRNGALLVRQTELFKIEIQKPKFEIPKFDDDILTGWNNGRLPNPVYLAYYKLNNQKFKCNDMTMPKTVTLRNKTYLYAASLGLYEVLF